MKRIVVLGAGESGAGAAVLAKKEGFDVFVSDSTSIKDKYKQLLDDHDIAWEEGGHTEADILNADEVIKSPGIPDETPIIQKLIKQQTHIISEIEFAGRYTHSKMICITGSNGKTTTTSLIYHIFKTAGYDVGLAGNIGRSLALQVAEDPHEYYIIELSSFQLDNMYDFRAHTGFHRRPCRWLICKTRSHAITKIVAFPWTVYRAIRFRRMFRFCCRSPGTERFLRECAMRRRVSYARWLPVLSSYSSCGLVSGDRKNG